LCGILSWATVALAAALAGCSIQPLPQDVARLDTFEIVQRIRCEAREAVLGYLGHYLGPRLGVPNLIADLRSGRVSIKEIANRKLDKATVAMLDKYRNAAIAFDFTFDITENNSLSGEAGFARNLTRGVLNIGVAAGNERQRQNVRNFRVTENVSNLVLGLSEKQCASASRKPNWSYPITGHIGVGELIGTFLKLSQTNTLVGPDTDDDEDKAAIPSITDTITFITTITGSVNPTIELEPLGRKWSLASAGINASASRADVHSVIVAVTLPPDENKRLRRGSDTLAGRLRAARARAGNLIDYQIYRGAAATNRQVLEKIRSLR